ncbi:DUF4142 domain-containing protein [Ramlibacter henchirensis]|uniref:DUF4142 domain-containing protein n=1 Tax=Ramlibacter henchirensis TaxID=204072 RepID=UPI0014305B75|nr:DUF4142 domain-containing protein [Ramlibacter henchirensis]
MVSRRWIWVAAGAAAALWFARAARAETEAEYLQGPHTARTQAPAAEKLPQPKAAAGQPAKPAPGAIAKTAPKPGRISASGYAADSARTATRLPPEERHARDFLRAAALHARFEVDASRLALARAENPGVRGFASDLLLYHEAADAELLHLLAARGMAPPMMENKQRKTLNRLAKLTGAKFDREFVAGVGRDRQREDVQRFEKAALGVADPVLRDWIDRQLPSLREQHSSATRLASGEPRRADAIKPAVARAAERPPRSRRG